MLEYMKAETNKGYTENGAVTYITTGKQCLDLFSTIGAMRNATDEEIIQKFVMAFVEDRDLAMKILFFARDIREGLGERRVFRVIVKWLANNRKETVIKNVKYIAEYGRFDDLLVLLGTNCEKEALSYIQKQFIDDCVAMENAQPISLLAKWLPSVNASNKETVKMAKKVAKSFNMNDATYRKQLSKLRRYLNIIENNLREKDYTFDYEKQPSRALFKYRMAFVRNDLKRYDDFMNRVQNGEAKLKAGNVAPYELVEPYLSAEFYYKTRSFVKQMTDKEREILNTTWSSLPNYCGDDNVIAVVDTSGSMYDYNAPKPASVAISLGIYLAEHNKGKFANHIITFSKKPKLIELTGDNLVDKLYQVSSNMEAANTDIEAVFRLILDVAVKYHVKQEELPKTIVIISDMEFDVCAENSTVTNFENAKNLYEQYGYRLPEIVFWNVACRNANQPVKANDRGVALVSGATPRLFGMIAKGKLSPYEFMLEVVESERYKDIIA